MNKYWPSYKSNVPFWGHEYGKHGTCATDIPQLNGEFKFFNTTLGLRATHDIGTALSKAGITPSKTAKYTAAQIRTALQSTGAGNQPLLGCINSSGNQYLHEVSFCLDKTLKTTQCDEGIRTLPNDEVSDCTDSKPIMLLVPGSQPLYSTRTRSKRTAFFV